MVFECLNVHFVNGTPNVNFSERTTYHKVDESVIAPKRLPKPGDTVVIKTIGMPQVKMIVNRIPEEVKPLGGPIVGKASFYDSAEKAPPDKGVTS